MASAPIEHGAPHDTNDPLIGATLKNTYRITRQIAVGGMGAVYEAEHVRLHRRVAVKVVLAHVGDDDVLAQRFAVEVEAIAQVGHPHIVQVVDVDRTESGMPYLVMEYLEGETLADYLDRAGSLPVATAVAITSQVAAALAEVHANGIVHRDLKPSNVFMVTAAGEDCFVKLLDFGVSKVVASGARRLTGAREVIGTPEYMAPEQAQGAAQDHRVDQFALAAIAYEALTGRQAFDGDDIATVLYRVLSVDPPHVTEVAPWVPDQFDAVIGRALSKDPAKRYPTISQFAYALESAAMRAGISREPSRSALPPGVIDPDAPGGGRADPGARTGVSVAPQPTARPGSSSVPPPSAPPLSGHNREATALFLAVREAWDAGDLEAAVRRAEQFLEYAAYDQDPAVPRVLARAMPVLDEIFGAYVGSLDGEVRAGPAYRSVRGMHLSPRAADLLALMERPTRISAVFRHAGIPERAGVRLLAGLIRRKVVERAGGGAPGAV